VDRHPAVAGKHEQAGANRQGQMTADTSRQVGAGRQAGKDRQGQTLKGKWFQAGGQ